MKVTLQNLTKKFPARGRKSRDEVIAVNDFNFEIPDGKLVGLLGPSGCGKSTALNLLCGLLKPTEGRIYFGKEDVTDLPPEKRGVGMVFQNYALYPHLTVKQNIQFPLENLKGADKLSKEEMQKRVLEAARLVQIDGLMERKPSELSGGQQQRVAIARALVKMPRILLMDEPLSNLDARLRLQTREEIRRIQKETKITTVFVTHDQEEAMSISDVIVVMKDGVIQQIGKPQEVYDAPKNLFVAKFLGNPPINVFEGSVRDGKLYLGDAAVMNLADAVRQESASARENASSQAGGSAQESASSQASGSDSANGAGQANGTRQASGSSQASGSTQPGSASHVIVGIRPEGFLPREDGPLVCGLKGMEIMGRDVSVLASHPALEEGANAFRAIVSAETQVDADASQIRFALKPGKVFVFSKDTEERLF